MTEPKSMSAIVPPGRWRIIGEHNGPPESYIPLNASPRSKAILDRTIAAIQSGEIAVIAARYLAEHQPDAPELAAFPADADDFDQEGGG